MAGIFLSYRRGPGASEAAGRLSDRLATRFGKDSVFMDVDTVSPGTDFVDAIEREIDTSRAVLAIIDPNWATDTTGRNRISEDADYVRLEIATALRRGVTVIPVLVLGAEMPSASALPVELRPLTRRQAVVLTHERFNTDVIALEHGLESLVEGKEPTQPTTTQASATRPATTPATQPPPPTKKRGRRLALLLVVAVVAAVAVFVIRPWSNGPEGGELVLENWEHRPDEGIVMIWGRNVGDDSATSAVVCEIELPNGERRPEEVGSVFAEPQSPFEQPLAVGPDVGVTRCWLG